MTVLSFVKRYPRICGICVTNRQFDMSTLQPRSDVWMSRFIEECYDEAYAFTAKPISDDRRRKRCGLDLGALDAFPLVVERILTRLFSNGELRQRVCLEIMVTIESISQAGEAAQLVGTFGAHAKGMKGADHLPTSHESVVADIKIDGGRVPLFAKFLAEELDLDYLAMFLQARAVVQDDVGVRLADANPQAVNEVLHAHPDPPVQGAFSFLSTDDFRNSMEMSRNRTANRTNEVHGTTFAGVAEGPKRKIVPFALPRNLAYLVDITMPHAQLVGVEHSRIDWIVSKLVPQSSPVERRYFADKILEAADKLLEHSNKRLEMVLPLHTPLPFHVLPARKGISAEGGYYVPLYCIFHVVCEMWKEVPLETKKGFMPSGSVAENLSELNDLYDNDNAIMKGVAKQIADTEIEKTEKKAAIMKVDKRKRRLERKWDHGMASADELMELQRLRVTLTEERAELTAIESRLDGFVQRQAYLRGGIENLWVAASSSTEVQAKEEVSGAEYSSSKLAPSMWREETMNNLAKAISFNEECMRAVMEASTKYHELGDEIVASVKERLAEEETKATEKPKEITVEERLRSIEQEALELSALGRNVAIEIGMEPPKPPEYIQDYLNDKEMAELKRLEQEKELASEESNLKTMQVEELMMRQFLEDLAFQEAHLARVAAFEEAQRKKAMLESIRAAATHQTTVLVEGSVRRLAEAAMREKMKALAAQALERQHQLESAMRYQAELVAQLEIDKVVSSSVQLGMERVTQRLLEEARVAMEERLRLDAMRRKLEAISQLATESVRGSVTRAVSSATSAAVAEIMRREQLELARLRQEEHDRQVQTNKVTVAAASVEEAVKRAQLYFEEQESLRQELARQLEEEQTEALALATMRVCTEQQAEEWAEEWVAGLIEALVEEDREEERRKKEEALNAAKALKALKYRIGRVSRALVKISFESAMINAKEVLTDPWLPLELEPEAFLDEELLGEVEEMYLISNMNRENRLKRAFFDVPAFQRTRNLRASHAKRMERRVFLEMRRMYDLRLLHDKMARRVSRYVMIVVMRRRRHKFAQHLQARCEEADIMAMRNRRMRAAVLVRWWKYWANVEARARQVEYNVAEREFMKGFYTWKHKFSLIMEKRAVEEKKRYAAATKILLLLKIKIMRRRKRKNNAIRAITCLGLMFIARRRAQERRVYIRRLQDLHDYAMFRHSRYSLALYRRKYQMFYDKASFFNKLHMLTMKKLVRRRFIAWKYGVKDRHALVLRCSLLIQRTVRMWIIKRYVINYYRWRRGLVAFQSHVRRRRVIPWFKHNIHLYRSARYIQRVYRGHYLREHLNDQRIIDLHYAAEHNNYDKLLYYSKKYPELLMELDSEGNTALHNAAKNAARRTLKLLLKHKLDPNALNLAGYSALHLIIMSNAVNRDDCCVYMLDVGFDEEALTPDGKTCLLLAVEYGRLRLVQLFLDNHLDPNQPDNNLLTCLQAACQTGLFEVLNKLVLYGADVNQPGYCGTFPLHDCIATGQIDFPNLLISHGAYVNVKEPSYQQTPLMWACRAGLAEFVSLYVLQGAHVNDVDWMGWTAGHHAALNGNYEVYDSLRVGDADFDKQDNQGDTPLHVAGSYGNTEFTQHLLLGGADCSIQNLEGNQPSHIAARDNQLTALQAICVYDKHIGRLNYQHQTPLGLAKFHNAEDCRAFLEKHYRMVEIEGGRNEIGEIWWDRDLDEVNEDWKVVVGFLGEREYVNKTTGERSLVPPSYPSRIVSKKADDGLELPLQRAVVLVGEEGENTLTRHTYKEEYAAFKGEVEDLAALHNGATQINKYARRKVAYMEAKRLRLENAKKKVISKFIKRHLTGFMKWKRDTRDLAFSKMQAKFKGDRFRMEWTKPDSIRGQYEQRHARVRLAFVVQRLWKRYKFMKAAALLQIAPKVPAREDGAGWAELIAKARYVRRTVGVYEEYKYPGTNFKIFFYRHKLSGECTFDKPARMRHIDDTQFRERDEILIHGCTLLQRTSIIKLQALYRGYKIRSYYLYVERAVEISEGAERMYMTYPEKDSSLYNYALHCHIILHDYPRARSLYGEAMRRMEWRGPDVAFVLYAYSIFCFYTHDLDYSDVLVFLERARKAEEVQEQQRRHAKGEERSQAIDNGTYRHGKIFDLANIGFFRKYASELETEASHHNYAICRFLIYNDFATSFDAFLEAFKHAPQDQKLKDNFDTMMRHFHGQDKRYLEGIVRDRMQYLAQREAEVQNIKQADREYARARNKAATKLQGWYKDLKQKWAFAKFMQVIKDAKAKKEAELLRAQSDEDREHLDELGLLDVEAIDAEEYSD